MLASPRHETTRLRIREQASEPGGFRFSHTPAQWRQAVVAPTVVVVCRIGSFAQLLDQLGLEQPLDHRIEGAGTQPDPSVRPFSDVLQDGVAMALAISEGDEDVKGVPRQWQEVVRFGAFASRSRHAPVYPSSL